MTILLLLENILVMETVRNSLFCSLCTVAFNSGLQLKKCYQEFTVKKENLGGKQTLS